MENASRNGSNMSDIRDFLMGNATKLDSTSVACLAKQGGLVLDTHNVRCESMGVEFIKAEWECVHPGIVGIVVENLTHVLTGQAVTEAFRTSLLGATVVDERLTTCMMRKFPLSAHENVLMDEAVRRGCTFGDYAKGLCKAIADTMRNRGVIDKTVVASAVQLARLDSAYKESFEEFRGMGIYGRISDTLVEHIDTMVKRSVVWLGSGNRVISQSMAISEDSLQHFSKVCSAELDFVVDADYYGRFGQSNHFLNRSHAVCDFKCSVTAKPNASHWRQVLMYWLCLLMNPYDEYKDVDRFCIFNPRYGYAWWYDLINVDLNLVQQIACNLMGLSEDIWYTVLLDKVKACLQLEEQKEESNLFLGGTRGAI